jgi:hypothetical protein
LDKGALRLTMEPLSARLGLGIHDRFDAKEVDEVAAEIRTGHEGGQSLICWHQCAISKPIQALGGEQGEFELLPGVEWPDSVSNWMIQLRYHAGGRLVGSKRIKLRFAGGDV